MIDYFNQIFDKVCREVWNEFGNDIEIKGEYVSTPSKFPTITIEERMNIPSNLDNGEIKYADVQYRVQIFTNSTDKRSKARKLFGKVNDILYDCNIICKTYTTIPEIYNSSIYEIQATFEATIDSNGTIYRR